MELIIFIVHCDLFLRHVQRENMMIFIARLRGENVHEKWTGLSLLSNIIKYMALKLFSE